MLHLKRLKLKAAQRLYHYQYCQYFSIYCDFFVFRRDFEIEAYSNRAADTIRVPINFIPKPFRVENKAVRGFNWVCVYGLDGYVLSLGVDGYV